MQATTRHQGPDAAGKQPTNPSPRPTDRESAAVCTLSQIWLRAEANAAGSPAGQDACAPTRPSRQHPSPRQPGTPRRCSRRRRSRRSRRASVRHQIAAGSDTGMSRRCFVHADAAKSRPRGSARGSPFSTLLLPLLGCAAVHARPLPHRKHEVNVTGAWIVTACPHALVTAVLVTLGLLHHSKAKPLGEGGGLLTLPSHGATCQARHVTVCRICLVLEQAHTPVSTCNATEF